MTAVLDGRVAIVTGAAGGLGRAYVSALAGAGAAVVAIDERPVDDVDGATQGVVADLGDEGQVERAVGTVIGDHGGIDIVVNNASAIDVSPSATISMKRYDLMQDVNARGTFLLSRMCLPYLWEAGNPHVLTLSPPLSLDPRWYGPHLAYTLAKFGMSMCTLGMAAEHADAGIAFNSLWPRTIIATAAVQNVLGGDAAMARSRRPEIVADAAHHILTRPARTTTGNFFIDDEVLAQAGVTDLAHYAYAPDADLLLDLFLES